LTDWLTWQIGDSAFPTGAFAHTWGLESAWQHGEVRDAGDLHVFLDATVLQTGFATLPFVNAAYREPNRLEALDDLAEAFLTNPVANRASRVQGRTLASTAARVWPSPDARALKARADATCAHVAPLAGAVFGVVGLPADTARRVLLYGAARGVLSAAVRLGIAGSYEAQRIQQACGEHLERVARRCADLTLDDLAQTAPVIDLVQGAHDRLYSRLFQS
jgi:urease accessory protein